MIGKKEYVSQSVFRTLFPKVFVLKKVGDLVPENPNEAFSTRKKIGGAINSERKTVHRMHRFPLFLVPARCRASA